MTEKNESGKSGGDKKVITPKHVPIEIREEFLARVVFGGRVTIPKGIRDEFDIHLGDYIKVELVYKMR